MSGCILTRKVGNRGGREPRARLHKRDVVGAKDVKEAEVVGERP